MKTWVIVLIVIAVVLTALVIALYFLGKNDPVETLDLVFRDRRYSLPRHPAIHFFLCWNLKKVKKALLVLPAQAWKKRRKVQRICFRMLHSVR